MAPRYNQNQFTTMADGSQYNNDSLASYVSSQGNPAGMQSLSLADKIKLGITPQSAIDELGADTLATPTTYTPGAQSPSYTFGSGVDANNLDYNQIARAPDVIPTTTTVGDYASADQVGGLERNRELVDINAAPDTGIAWDDVGSGIMGAANLGMAYGSYQDAKKNNALQRKLGNQMYDSNVDTIAKNKRVSSAANAAFARR